VIARGGREAEGRKGMGIRRDMNEGRGGKGRKKEGE